MDNNRIKKGLRLISIIAVSLIVLVPIICFIMASFMPYESVLRGFPRLSELTFTHYVNLFKRLPIVSLLADTSILSMSSSIIAIIFALPCAYYVSRNSSIISKSMYTISLTIWLIPPVALSLTMYLWFIKLGIYDRLGGLILLNGVINSTLAIILLTPFLDSIPKRLDEAAWIDGLKGFNVIKKIHFPLISGLLFGVFALCFVRNWNELLFSSILTDTKIRLLPVAMLGITSGSHINWGEITALGTFALLPAPLTVLIFWVLGLFGRKKNEIGQK